MRRAPTTRYRRHFSGLTMVEILVTVAILGLLVAVFLLWLRPDDDRRCRLEAQRLAAYLISAEANSVMRDGPVRVAFSFADNTGKREFRRTGASLAEMGWELDKKADTHTVGRPVKLDTIETPIGGAVKSGNAWLNFNGHRTPGGVAVLSLNEAVYSVLVPPRGQGEIKVAKGRASLKDPKTFEYAQPGSLPAIAFEPNLGGGTGLPPLGAPVGGPAQGGPPASQPQDDVDPDDTPPIDDPEVPPVEPPVNPIEPPAQPPEPEEEPEEDPEDDPDAECQSHADCIATMGSRGVCVGGPDGEPNQQDPSQNRCRANLEGMGFRVRSAQVTQPEGFAGLLNPVVNSYITNGKLNLTVFLQTRISWEPSNDGYRARYLSWSFNANSNTSLTVLPHGEFPTARADSLATNCGEPYTSCHNIISQEQTLAGESNALALWLPRAGYVGQNECPYQLLEVVGSLDVSVDTTNNAASPAYVRLSGMITTAAARRLEIKLPGVPLQSLKTLFEENGVDVGEDSNGDGIDDAWRLAFEGPAVPVSVDGNLEGARSNNPCFGYE